MGDSPEQACLKLQKILILFLFLIAFASCQNENKAAEAKDPIISTFYLIRHAEKDRADSTNLDPELSQKGLDRAIRWAEVFDKVELDAIFSTNYERTTMTAAPTSVKKNIDIQFYDPGTLDIEEFKSKNSGLNVLVVGHSNTTPVITNQLMGEEMFPLMDDNDNSSLFIVRFIDDQVTSLHLNMD